MRAGFRVALLGTLLSALASSAFADHTETQHITDNMPYTLRPAETRIGLWKVEQQLFGHPIAERFQIGTHTLTWLGWLFDAPVADFNVKANILPKGPFAATVGIALVYASLPQGDDDGQERPHASIKVIPIEARAGYRFNDTFTLAAGAQYSQVAVDGSFSGDKGSLSGAVAVSNLQLSSTLEIRLNHTFAFLLEGRIIPYQHAEADGVGKYKLDQYTTAKVVATAGSDAFAPKNSLLINSDLFVSWGSFNLRAGIAYGNYSVPIVNFVIPEKYVIPNFDMFWKF